MAYKELTFNGHSTGDYGIYISSDTYLNAPSIDYTEYQVPARNGSLVQYNKRLNNIVRKFSLFMPVYNAQSLASFKHDLYAVRGYMRIESDYDPDVYQFGYLAEEVTITPFRTDNSLQATIEVYFSCQPQKYLKNNTSASAESGGVTDRIKRIVPRNSTLVQKVFSALPVGDIPEADAFILYMANGSNNTAAVTSITASVTEFDSYTPLVFDGFIAAIFASFDAVYGYTFDSLITHTSTGSLSDTSSHSPSVASNVYLLMAAGTEGVINSSVTRGQTVTREDVALPCADIMQDATFQGVSYTIRTAPTVLRYRDNPDPTCIFVKGESQTDEATYFEGVISIYGDKLHDYLTPNQASDLTVEMTIDSETLDAKVRLQGETAWRDANAYIEASGNIEGRGNEVKFFYYHEPMLSLELSSFDINPRWWTI